LADHPDGRLGRFGSGCDPSPNFEAEEDDTEYVGAPVAPSAEAAAVVAMQAPTTDAIDGQPATAEAEAELFALQVRPITIAPGPGRAVGPAAAAGRGTPPTARGDAIGAILGHLSGAGSSGNASEGGEQR